MFHRSDDETFALVPDGTAYDHMVTNQSNQDHRVPVDRNNGLSLERNDICKEKSAELPDRQNRHGRLPTRSDSSENNKRKRLSSGTVNQFSVLHLYRIQISDDDCLGFLTPHPLVKLPVFIDKAIRERIQISYIGRINNRALIDLAERFCQYLFEEFFDMMNIKFEFDARSSVPLFLPCFLKRSNELDHLRMEGILGRDTCCFQCLSQLNEGELYTYFKSKGKQLCIFVNSAIRFGIPNGYSRAKMKSITKPSLDRLRKNPWSIDREREKQGKKMELISINELHLAPLNPYDTQLLQKMPHVLRRVSQLCRIVQMKHEFSHQILHIPRDVEKIPIDISDDCFTRMLSPTQTNRLPLESINYDRLNEITFPYQLPLDLLFQAVTSKSTEEKGHLESLETLGDSFLKFIISLSVYHQYPSDSVKKLASEKDKQVSNKNLGRLAKEKGLDRCFYLHEIKYEGTHLNWIPSGFYAAEDDQKSVKLELFADMIEALIAAFLLSTDYSKTIKFLDWLGSKAIPKDDNGQIMPTPSVLCRTSSLTTDEIYADIQTTFQQNGFATVENVIKYTFQDQAYLIAAFTHKPQTKTAITINYERLKYIGNAVLEFLITRYICLNKETPLTPGGITNARKDALDEHRRDIIMVANQLHQYIICNPPNFLSVTFCKPSDERNYELWDGLDVPEAISNVFDALFGAIFLDSNYSLQVVWNVFIPLYQRFFDLNYIIEYPIKNVVEVFYERQGEIIEETKTEKDIFQCRARLPRGNEVVGLGRSKRRAHKNACKQLTK